MSEILPVLYEDRPCYSIRIESSFSAFSEAIYEIVGLNYEKVCIVTDTNVAKLYLDEMEKICKDHFRHVFSFIFTAGESSKNLDTVQKLYEHLINNRFDRRSLLIALGGGVVGDLTGFAASTFLRGIDFIQVPTTLLSQVDSSIGGKTGVDFLQYKNMVGAFYMPRMVYINTATLQTLPPLQFTSGMGEVIKHGLIQNQAYYLWLREHQKEIQSLDPAALEKMVLESCKIKKHVVEKDPKEKNIRAYLNFGHTIGHAIEKLSDFSLCHGHCVALGMHGALYLSKKRGLLTQEAYENALDTIRVYGLPLTTTGIDDSSVLQATKSDKKMAGDHIKFVVLDGVGQAKLALDFTDEDLQEAIHEILVPEGAV